jgi:hypothetical protein
MKKMPRILESKSCSDQNSSTDQLSEENRVPGNVFHLQRLSMHPDFLKGVPSTIISILGGIPSC